MNGTFVEFYGKNKISPVRQDISNLKHHFERRESLYRQLGIFPLAVEGKSILEIGPGSGHNSIYTASLRPSIYHLVDENLKGIEDMKELFSQFPEWMDNSIIFNEHIENFNSNIKYDIVFCEGMLPSVGDPVSTLKIIKNFVKPGGILVITCIDSISGSSENLRNLIGTMLVAETEEINEKLEILLPAFSPHLNTLKGMSRRHDDWILDNIINPFGIAETLSIAKAVEELDNEFEFFGSSPCSFSDWRWYKSIYGETKSFNNDIIKQYWCQVHNFLDYRKLYPPREESKNKKLYSLFDSLRTSIKEFKKEKNQSLLEQIITTINDIVYHLEFISHELALPFKDVLDIITSNKLDPSCLNKCENLKSFFGRGQQYLSLVKNME